MFIRHLTVGPFQENTWILADEETKDAVVFDPGDEADVILAKIEKHNLNVRYILNTHAHLDHVCAVDAVKKATGAEWYLHPDDLPLLERLTEQAAMFGLPQPAVPEVDHHLAEGDTFDVGGLHIRTLFAPGHAPGHVVFVVNDEVCVCGDVIFPGSIGRTDLPGGNYETLMESIINVILPLGDEVALLPGHMYQTTVGREKTMNPFVLQYLAEKGG